MSAPNKIQSMAKAARRALKKILSSRLMQYLFVAFNIGAQGYLWYGLIRDVLAGKWGVGMLATFGLGPFFVAAGLFNHIRGTWGAPKNESRQQPKPLAYLMLTALVISLAGNGVAVGFMGWAGVPWGWPDTVVAAVSFASFPIVLWFYDGKYGNKLHRATYIAIAIGVATSVVAQLTDAAVALVLHRQPMPTQALVMVSIIVAGFLLNTWRLLLFTPPGEGRVGLIANKHLFQWRSAATVLLWAALIFSLYRA